MTATSGEATAVTDLASEVGYLRDLFQRKLFDDKAKNQLIASVQDSLAGRDALDRGEAFRGLFEEALVAIDRLRAEAPSAELSESVAEELLEVFGRRGLSPVRLAGPVDPRIHEIVEVVELPEGREPGDILCVERDGYQLGERLLRPARVVIGADTAPGQ
jgi:molecular chaperone GrpE